MFRVSVNTTQLLSVLSLLIVFVIDIITPVEYVFDVMYLFSVVLVFKQSKKMIIAICAVTCLLIVLNIVHQILVYGSFDTAMRVNRGISIFAVLTTSYIAIHYNNLNEASKSRQLQHIRSLKEMLFKLSHEVRKPVANILGLAEVIKMEEETISAANLRRYCEFIGVAANELDHFINDLNTFIKQAEPEHIPGEIQEA